MCSTDRDEPYGDPRFRLKAQIDILPPLWACFLFFVAHAIYFVVACLFEKYHRLSFPVCSYVDTIPHLANGAKKVPSMANGSDFWSYW